MLLQVSPTVPPISTSLLITEATSLSVSTVGLLSSTIVFWRPRKPSTLSRPFTRWSWATNLTCMVRAHRSPRKREEESGHRSKMPTGKAEIARAHTDSQGQLLLPQRLTVLQSSSLASLGVQSIWPHSVDSGRCPPATAKRLECRPAGTGGGVV